MANETMKLAAELVKNPKLLDEYPGQYLIVMDQALTYPRFDILNQAICLMAEKGWQAVNITTVSNTIGLNANMMYALMARTTPGNEPTNKFTEQFEQQAKGFNEQSQRIADVLERLEQKLGNSTASDIATVNGVEQTNSVVLTKPQQHPTRTPDNQLCTKCSAPMVIRTVTKGEQKGKQFYVCSNYPKCQEVLPA
jgi:hypothetical protein